MNASDLYEALTGESVDAATRPPAESQTRVRTRRRASVGPNEATSEPATGLRVQGNWKRRQGVATRYELETAIARMLASGKVVIADGLLRLARAHRERTPTTREERWRRADEELQAYCHRLDVHETRSRRAVESADMASSMFEASVARGSPRRGVDRYVRRELRDGPLDYELLIARIFEQGGLEWMLEDLDVARERARRGTGNGKTRRQGR